MSKIEVNQISSQCGSTLTIGQSGDTVTLAAGATQSGFGRTGTVDWDTTAKTTNFTAVSGTGYFVNTTSGVITMTLPATPSAGDIVAFKDYANTFDTNNLTIARNGSPISGLSADAVISVEGQSGTLVYVDGTKGWMIVNASTDADLPAPSYITATGGTITTCGNYKIHTFTGPGTFCVSNAGNPAGSNTVDYLVVAGGGGATGEYNGGGGGGGFRESSGAASGCYSRSPLGACVSALPVSVTGYPITVGGGGGSPGADNAKGNPGSNSVFSTITSTGGGGAGSGAGGASGFPIACGVGQPGGSGGGAGGYGPGTRPGGAGNTPPVSPPQGQSGGSTTSPCAGYSSAGGGGATATGASVSNPGSSGIAGGAGGNGATSSINGTPTARAGGGGGGSWGGTGGAGGLGGGANGLTNNVPGTANGTANTGGGAGGGGPQGQVNSGGSGIVIIRYKYQ